MSSRVRDLRSVIAYLSTREEVDQERMILWGDSLAAINNGSVQLVVPFNADPSPELGEPLGGVAVLLGALAGTSLALLAAGPWLGVRKRWVEHAVVAVSATPHRKLSR